MCRLGPNVHGATGRSSEDRILTAAERLIASGDRINLSRVARAAGISRGTVYRCFGGRDGLLDALARDRGVETPRGSTRERLLDAVGALIAERGMNGVTFEAVARLAGTGQATVYRMFGDRRGLLTSFVTERTPKRLVSTLSMEPNDGDLFEDLLGVARELLAFMRDHRELLHVALDPDPRSAELFVDIRRSAGSTREALAAYFERQIRAGRMDGDPGRLAAAFFGMAFGLGLGDGEHLETDIDDLARFAVRTLLHGHAVKSGGGEDIR